MLSFPLFILTYQVNSLKILLSAITSRFVAEDNVDLWLAFRLPIIKMLR